MASTVTALLDEVYDGLYDRPAHMDLQKQGGGACCARGANLRINCDPWREATPHLRVRLHCHSQQSRRYPNECNRLQRPPIGLGRD